MTRQSVSIKKIFEGPFYTEGPAVDHAGNSYFTTLSGGQIMQIDQAGKVTLWAESSCPNGQAILPNGMHLICNSKSGCLEQYGRDGEVLRTRTDRIFAGVEVCCPNDVISDRTENIYFTDSIRHTGKVFFLGKDGSQRTVAEHLDYPNGLVLSKDGETLFVAESYQNRILSCTLREPGLAEPPTVFCSLPAHPSGKATDNLPDGLTLDDRGNVWVAHYGMGAIHRLSTLGVVAFTVETGMPLISNLLFMDAKTLLVTGGYGEPGPGAVLKITLAD